MIKHISDDNIFQLDTEKTSYVMQVKYGYLRHLYWGPSLGGGDHSYMSEKQRAGSFSPLAPGDKAWSLDTAPMEYPTGGAGDMRISALDAVYADGSMATDLVFLGHEIIKGKPKLKGLPQIIGNDGAETLIITLEDQTKKLQVKLSYSVFPGYNVLVRSTEVINCSNDQIAITKCMSANVDFDWGEFDEIHLKGAWARERYVERAPITCGIKKLESRRGASGHPLNPFFALAEKETSEQHGNIYGFSLIYSGNFSCEIEKEQYGTTRSMLGISPYCFKWNIAPGESFKSPEAVLVHSEEGLGGMSYEYHRVYKNLLGTSKWKSKKRPVVINNWGVTYFDFDEEKIVKLAKQAKELGIEMIVMDDGWFGKRNDTKSSLGDWYENEEKLPQGLAHLTGKIKALGMDFGLWFEPEMISPDSELYRTHPDWCLHIEGRRKTLGRNQLVLDMSRKDVCRYIIDSISNILEKASVDFVKWDFNRNLTEIYSVALPPERQGEVYHRFMLGTYFVLEKLTERFPDVLFEGCSGGGGRFDPGMLYYSPQIWASDNTDGVERIKIHYGTSLVYPLSSISAHVSEVSDLYGNRTPFDFRGHVSMTGSFGYELDLENLSAEERAAVIRQISDYKRLHNVITNGRLYRLRSPFKDNDAAWMIVSADKKEFLVYYFLFGAQPNAPFDRLRLHGLDGNLTYANEAGDKYTGLQLMNFGLYLPKKSGEYNSAIYYFTAQE